MATQILVIFVIRTYGPAWASRAQAALVASSLAALAVAVALVVTPLGEIFAFVPLPWTMLCAIGGLVAVYLASAEVAKKFASRRLDRQHLR
jgi:Mg2+-importing ATPase